jgi:hypothetical protein
VKLALGALVLAACSRTPPAPKSDAPTPAAGADAVAAAPEPSPTPPAGDPPVAADTEVTLKSTSSPSATVGGLTLTLLSAIEFTKAEGGAAGRGHRVKLRVESGSDKKEIFLTDQSSVFGHTLTLKSAGDGQADPHAPREAIAVIAVKAAP